MMSHVSRGCFDEHQERPERLRHATHLYATENTARLSIVTLLMSDCLIISLYLDGTVE